MQRGQKLPLLESLLFSKMENELKGNIEGFPNYFVTKDGRVFNTFYGRKKQTKEMSKQLDRRGYEYVKLVNNGFQQKKKVHRLVALAFLENPLKKETVNHIDGIKTNNKLCNLEWNTWGENQIHAIKTGLKKRTTKQINKNNLTNKQIKEIYESDKISRYFENKYSISKNTIQSIRRGLSYKNITENLIKGNVIYYNLTRPKNYANQTNVH